MRRAAFILACLIGIVARLYVSTLGFNHDVHMCFWPVASQGIASPYPVLSWMLFRGLGLFAHDIRTFHVALAGVLSLADLGTALLLARYFDFWAGVFFILCPISILLTGFHSQLEPIAILCGLASYLLLQHGRPVSGGIVMAAGLLTKQVFALFPAALLFWRERPLWERVTFAALAYTPLAVGWLLSPPMQGVHYPGAWKFGLLTKYFAFPHWLPVFFGSLLVVTAWAAWRHPRRVLPVYVTAIFGLSPGVSDAYLVIPTLAWAWTRTGALWAYVGIGTLALLAGHTNVPWYRDVWPYMTDGPESSLIPQSLLVAALADLLWSGRR